MEAGLDASLGYEKNHKGDLKTSNKRNGHFQKTLKSQYGEFQIVFPETVTGNLNLINTLVKDYKGKLHVFDENNLYLATKKIGKNNPKVEQIQTDNGYHMRWNRKADRVIVSGVAEREVQQIKKSTSLTVSMNPLMYSVIGRNGLDLSL